MSAKRAGLRASTRSLFLLREFGQKGETLELPPNCELEFPDAPLDRNEIDSGKYKRFIVHYRPEEGIYANGVFRIEFDVRDVKEYPFQPPKAKMLTKIWHVNVDDEGNICHNYLKTDAIVDGGYSPVLGMSGLVFGIITMFDVDSDSFNPADGLNPAAVANWFDDKEGYIAKAKEYTAKYATPVKIPPHCRPF
eukprot:CAMPEP_0174241588 /NCGR_PEP_ID=MMETSP0417-20130205/23894_1 /TAXON_ID=242541 /ORGANISM="Mayorella sp, Strain BSH-02190019" /LENGTH=192 /DNA_ID=CAMNT_0015320845 /DNA_START=49 /DNA_END=624 /DNA_ORIENTATION=+